MSLLVMGDSTKSAANVAVAVDWRQVDSFQKDAESSSRARRSTSAGRHASITTTGSVASSHQRRGVVLTKKWGDA